MSRFHAPSPLRLVPSKFRAFSKSEGQPQSYAQHIFFHSLFIIAGLFLANYYVILLLRRSDNSIPHVVLSYAGLYTGILLGFYLGSSFLNKLGYLRMYRLASFLYLVFTLLTVITIDQIMDVYLVVILIRGVALGLFHTAYNIFTLREIHGAYRGRTLSVIASLDLLFSVLLPIVAGALIESNGYEIAFMLAALIYMIGVFYPWTYHKIPKGKFNMGEIKQASKRKGFKRWSILTVVSAMLANQREIVIAIIPFLFIRSEFGVGAFTSLVALVGMSFAFLHRNDDIRKRLKFGYIGGVIIDLATIIFVFIWNIPALVIRGMVVKFGLALYSPNYQDLMYRNRELLLGDFTQESAVELQVYIETLLYIARMLNVIMFIILLFVVQFDPMNSLRVILAVTSIREVLGLFFRSRLNIFLKR